MTDQERSEELIREIDAISRSLPEIPNTFGELRALIANLPSATLPNIRSARAGANPSDGLNVSGFGASDSPLSGDAIGSGSGAALGSIADLFGNQGNYLLDPTFELAMPFTSVAASIGVGPGWTNVSGFWRARYTLNSGTAPTGVKFSVASRRQENAYSLHSSVAALDITSGVADTCNVTIDLEPISGFTPLNSLLTNVIAALRISRPTVLLFTGTQSVVVSVVNAAGAVVASSTAVTISGGGLGAADFRRIAAFYTDTIANLQAGSWKIRISYTIARTVATGVGPQTVALWMAEPQLSLSPIQGVPPFSPLVGAWGPPLEALGYEPWAGPPGAFPSATFGSFNTLPINGGTILVPIRLAAPMLLQSYTIGQKDAANAHTLEARLYWDTQADARGGGWSSGGGTGITAIPGTDATFTYTPAAADVRVSTAVSGAPVVLPPGVYWLAIRNTSATVTAGLGVSLTGTYATGGVHQIKTLAAALPATTLDAVTGWTKGTSVLAAYLNGRVFGQTVGY